MQNNLLQPSTCLFLSIVIFANLAGAFTRGKPACAAFRVHREATLPEPALVPFNRDLPKDWEEKTVGLIGNIKTQEKFPLYYRTWLSQHPTALTAFERHEWLSCILYYVSIDTNANNIPDWTAIVDNQPAKVLFANDSDIDGDGVENVLDPSPLNAKVRGEINMNRIPLHLEFDLVKRPQAASFQQKIFKEFGIIAIDHTDEHSPVLLRELYVLLKNGFSKKWILELKNIRYVYAFASHDSASKIAAYHWQARSLSVGGVSAYPDKDVSVQQRVDLVAALAHEIGHAVLLDTLTVNELADIGKKFGGWKMSPTASLDSFYSTTFFTAYPKKADLLRNQDFERNNIVSEYAMTNVHEWFADSFAAHIVNRLGQRHTFGTGWEKYVTSDVRNRYWAKHNNLTLNYRDWLDAKPLHD